MFMIMRIRQLLKTKEDFFNSFLVFMGKALSMILLLLLDSVIAYNLGMKKYAEWSFFYAVLTIIFNISWFGINSAGKVYVASCIDEKSRNKYYSTAVVLRVIISTLFFMIILFGNFILYYCFDFENKRYPNILIYMFYSGLLLILNNWTDFVKNIFQGLNAFKYFFILNIAEYGGYFLFSLPFLFLLHDGIGIIWGYIITGALIILISIKMLKKKRLFLSLSNIEKKDVKEVLFYAIDLMLASIGSLFLMEIDTIMMGILSTNQQVSIYSLSKNLCQKATHVNLSYMIATVTTFAVINKKNIAQKFNKFIKLQGINLVITGVVSAIVFIGGPIYIKLFYGNEFIGANYIIRLLLIYYILSSISGFGGFLLDFQKKVKIRSRTYIIVIGLDLVLNYLWIPKYGASGAAMATIISIIPYVLVTVISSFKLFLNFKNEND